MTQRHSANYVHAVFSTKDRNHAIPRELHGKLWASLIGTATIQELRTLAIGGTSNHVHVLIGIPESMTVAEVVQRLKDHASRWLAVRGVTLEWEAGCDFMSVSPSLLEKVRADIRDQEQHHLQYSFEEELRAFVDRAA